MEYFKPIENILSQYSWWGNTLWDYSMFLCILIGCILVLKIFQNIILSRLKKLTQKTETTFDDAVIGMFENVRSWFFIFLALYVGLRYLTMPDVWLQGVRTLLIFGIAYEVAKAVRMLADFSIDLYLDKITKTEKEKTQGRGVLRFIRVGVMVVYWSLALLLILSNLGVNVTSLIAGLGIGGIAVALAVQNILSDLFSSFTIFLDKPFQVGDFIKVGEDSGTVQHIGLKTTQLKTLRGEELVIPNKELTSSRILNFRKMKKRRDIFVLGVTYETSKEKLSKIPALVQKAIESAEKTEFDRCHFFEYAASSLNYEIVYYVQSAEYSVYMDIRQAVNMAIFESFAKEGIEFAYPTQTVHVKK
ncbi:mechanosensitive ion channel family protein [Candidatus Nomurabacteria bacterium]|nr:mechanosensitive ion channel family protein [Candidatus Nomurabacteria bacterium]